jgi:hypothetical protein
MRNLANNTAWGAKESRNQVRKREKIALHQSLIYIHPFHPLTQDFVYLLFFNSVAKKKISSVEKILGRTGGICPPPPPSYVCAKHIYLGAQMP